jgi:hypothetical protein
MRAQVMKRARDILAQSRARVPAAGREQEARARRCFVALRAGSDARHATNACASSVFASRAIAASALGPSSCASAASASKNLCTPSGRLTKCPGMQQSA